MSAQSVEKRFKAEQSTLGRAALNALFPKDIEFYALFLELVNSQQQTIDFFIWPILPDEIRENQVELTSVRKTFTATNVQKNSTFNPFSISIKGDFGRKFKLILGAQQIVFAGFSFSTINGKFTIKPPNFLDTSIIPFSTIAKSGYGCVKLLEAMKNKSKQLDEFGKPHMLYLYNPILGNNYQVEFNTFTHMQDQSRYNMFPGYSMQLTAVADLDMVMSARQRLLSATTNITSALLQKKANGLASNLRSLI